MHPLVILLISALPEITESTLSCGVSVGPCLAGGSCPSTTQTCLGGNEGECCENADILSGGTTAAPIQAPTQAPTQAATPTCVDQVSPLTGVSDCPRLSYLCTNSLYYTLMTQQCPLTCNRCNGATQQSDPNWGIGLSAESLPL
ncbi:unnamed protein product [Cylicocyclus nassatus]|uniref:ShKT domain-containing protein n=1 Tax=Cylicocyclus nassatus TaxID=53992 RepID=A0AA36DKV2_CYLNA|nr:unnamed protein product [Cylicocyclus nassatus]